jgi:hypothetical protein
MPYIKVPFAQLGDKATIPETAAGLEVNFTTGYTAAYEADPDTDPTARYVERDGQNQLFFVLTSNDKQWYENLYPPFITAAENGGTPFSYKKNMIVSRAGINYISLEDNNQDTPPSAKWAENSRSASLIENDEGGTAQDHFDATEDAHPASAINVSDLPNLGLTEDQLQNILGALLNGAVSQRQTSATDDATNRLLLRGAWGLGGNCITVTDFNAINKTGFYYGIGGLVSGAPTPNGAYWMIHFEVGGSGSDCQIAISQDNGAIHRRIKKGGATTFQPWQADGTPVGSYLERPLSSTPEGYLPISVSSTASRTEYPDLFDYLGTSIGPGDGSTTFDLPVKTGPDSFFFIKY